MIKKLHTYSIGLLLKAILCLGILVALGTTKAMAQFAVSEDFRGAGNPDIIIGDNAYLTSGNGDPVNGGWLRLTSAATYQKGFAYVDRSFPSTLGVLVDFEYKTWRDVNDGYNGADGIGVFLFNGDSSNTFSLGGYGGSLGYAPNGVGGLNGGYVGIGLDEYGNFSNPTEGRNGGPGERPNAIVLRGPTTSNSGTTNPYLAGTTIRTTDGGATFTYSTTATGVTSQNALDYNTVTSTRPTDSQFYRRIQIKIERLTTGGQYKITVRWKTTPTGAFVDVTSYTTTDVPPALLKLGFAASTGGGVNYHEIRNLLVTTPNNMRVKKTANKDFIRTVAGSGSENQIIYTIEITNDTPEPVYNIDFVDRITDADGNLIPKYNNITTPNGFEITSVSASGFTSGTPTVALLSNTITGTFAMPANSVATITVTGTLRNYTPSGNVVVNTATATPPYDDDLNNNTSIVETPVLAEGIDIVPTHTLDENCADGSNTFTVNVSNVGVQDASITTGGSSNRLRVFITVPQPNVNGYGITWDNTNGWTLQNTTNAAGNTTYEYRSSNSATIASGQAYNYPIVYTITKTGAATAYTTTAEARYTNNNGNTNLEPVAARNNNTASVSIVTIPNAPTANNVYYCLGETASPLTATASSGNVLKWYFSATGGFSSDYAPTPLTDVAGVQSYWVTQTRGTCESPRRQINVYTAPTPTPGSIGSDQYFCSGGGDPALLTSVTAGTIGSASGLTLTRTYQWQISTNNATWTNISGATNATYDPPAITATRYYRRITVSTNTTNGGSYQCQSAPTNVVTVKVYGNNLTGGVISGPGRVCSGSTATLNNDLNGGDDTVNYQWQSSTIGSPFNWVDIPGATSASYTTGPLTARTWFRRLAVNPCVTGTTGDINVDVTTINPGSLGADKTICYNTSPGTLGSGTGTSNGSSSTGTVSYTWQSAPGATGGTFTTIAGQTGATYAPGNLTATIRYRRISTNTSNGVTCDGYVDILVTVQTTPVAASITAPSPNTICYGSSVTIASGGTGTGDGVITYRWESSAISPVSYSTIAGQTGATLTVNPTVSTMYRRYTVSTVNTVACESVATNAVTINVQGQINAGTIGSDQSICSGATPSTLTSGSAATVSPSLSGTTIAYRWEYSTDGGTTWTTAPGTGTNATYSFPGGISASRLYRRVAVVTANSRSCESPSGTIAINVVTPTAGSIAANQTICFGTQPSQFTSATGGAGTGPGTFTYQWQSSDNGTSNWNDIGGATSETYQEPSTLTATKYYRRYTKSNTNGTTCQSPYTNVITVTVAGQVNDPGSFTASNQYICSGANPAQITSQNAGSVPAPGTISYVWQSSTDNGVTWSSDIAGATGANYTPPGPMTQNTLFRRLIVGTYNGTQCRSGWGPQIAININAIATGGQIGSDQTVCSGTAPTQISNVTSGNNTNGGYQWQSSTDNVTWTDISGANNADYQPGTITQTTYYRRLGRSNNGGNVCTGTSPSNVVTMTVPSVPTPGTIGSNQNVCGNAVPALLTSSSAGTGGTSYQWQESYDNSYWANITGATSATFQPPALSSTRYYRRLYMNNGCASAPSNVVLITVNVYPNPDSIAADQTVCSGSIPATITGGTGWAGGGTGSYRWYSSTDNATWTFTGVTTQNYTFSAALASTTYYRRGLTSSPCYGEVYTNTVTITVVPGPVGGTAAANQTICNGATPAALTVTGSSAGTYRWDVSTDNVNWTSTGVTTAGYAPGALTATRYYRRAIISGSCTGEAYSTTVTITVQPVINGGTAAADQSICNGGTATALTVTGASAGTYRWEVSTDGSTWSSTGVTTANYSPGSLTATRYYRRATISGSCEGFSTIVIITVSAVPTAGAIAANQSICSGATPAALTSTTAGTGTGAITYAWQSSTDGGVTWSADIAGATGATYAPGALTQTTRYQRFTIATNGSATCRSVATTAVIITVSAVPTAGAIAANQNICSGSTPSALTSTTAGTGTGTITYAWQSSTDGGATWSADIAGATGATYAPGALTQTTRYQRFTIATNGSAICRSVATTAVVITVSAAPTAGSLTANQNICMDNAPAVIGPGTAGTGSGTVTYIWESSLNGTTGWTVIAGATSASYQPPVIHSTTYYRRTTVATSTVSGNTVQCQSAPTSAVTVVTRNCKVITNPMIRSKVN
ncbi:Ig-like domain-containing protein [Flavobacterium suzhouense]|uniref:Ig-like domain-containing protein n=1 Tax=Flavobacterium suzhouense TaxID=1529638 RepID=A0ABW5NXQ8_9FLAO